MLFICDTQHVTLMLLERKRGDGRRGCRGGWVYVPSTFGYVRICDGVRQYREPLWYKYEKREIGGKGAAGDDAAHGDVGGEGSASIVASSAHLLLQHNLITIAEYNQIRGEIAFSKSRTLNTPKVAQP